MSTSLPYFKSKTIRLEQDLKRKNGILCGVKVFLYAKTDNYIIVKLLSYAIKISRTKNFPDYPPDVIFVNPSNFHESKSAWPKKGHIMGNFNPPFICLGCVMGYWRHYKVTLAQAKENPTKFWTRAWKFTDIIESIIFELKR